MISARVKKIMVQRSKPISNSVSAALGTLVVAFAMLIGLLGCVSVALAQDFTGRDDGGNSANRAHIGTFYLRSDRGIGAAGANLKSAVPDYESGDHWDRAFRPAQNSMSQQPDSAVVLEVFADARDAHRARNFAHAQRLYEQVIGLSPDSELAQRSREALAGLYKVPNKDRPGQQAEYHSDEQREVLLEQALPDVGPNETPRYANKRPDDGESDQSVLKPEPTRSGLSQQVYGPARPTLPAHTSVGAKPEKSNPRRPQLTLNDQRRLLVMLERQFIAEVGDRVFFEDGSATLGPRARDVLAAQAVWLRSHPDILATIEGHADDDMTSEAKQDSLSQARAEAVRQRLLDEGINPARISSLGLGRSAPVANCSDVACAAQNRRVVTVITMTPVQTAGDTNRILPDVQPASLLRQPASHSDRTLIRR